MIHALYHAYSSSKAFGGVPDDYFDIHNFFDQGRKHLKDGLKEVLR